MRRARTAAQQAADVVEHIISVVGDDYLETAQHLYSWLQLSMIDVYIAIIAVIAVAAALAGGLVWLFGGVYRYVCGSCRAAPLHVWRWQLDSLPCSHMCCQRCCQ